MKRERGDGSPPLPSDDALGISTPALEPSAACGPGSGDGKKPDQHEADDETDPGGAANRFPRGAVGSRRLGAVLPIVGVESLASRICVPGSHDERPAIEPPAEAMGNTAGGEDRGPFVDPAAVRRHADSSAGKIIHLAHPTSIARESNRAGYHSSCARISSAKSLSKATLNPHPQGGAHEPSCQALRCTDHVVELRRARVGRQRAPHGKSREARPGAL